MRKNILAWIIVLILVAGGVYYRDQAESAGVNNSSRVVISLGQDLSQSQQQEVISYFSKNGTTTDARYITVSNAEERQYLKGVVDESVIGTRAISSAYVEIMESGQGINVKTHNITWVTPFMYANALTTAGIKDALVVVAAPFEVSGTAGLTGIIKAFETASGKKISENAKQTANQEVAETSKLGQKIGKDKAETFIYEVKRQVIEKKTSDPQEIRRIIVDVSGKLNIKLTTDEIDRITALMQKINQLNINLGRVNEQLKTWRQDIEKVKGNTREAVGIVQQILNFLRSLIDRIAAVVS
ncbi:MAG: DUF1002 domain-containing protein [Syntrophomonas sp.]